MIFRSLCVAAGFFASLAASLPSKSSWKRATPQPDQARATEVQKAFQLSWQGYYEHAFPHDTLHPVDGGNSDDRDAWGVTAVDALSTAIVMRERTAVGQILQYIPNINFTTTKQANAQLSLFETNIRYLGGLLSSYDLLKGPFIDLVEDANQVEALLHQAISLANTLSIAFHTPSGIPIDTLFLNPARVGNDTWNSPAGFGTLVLEWTRLSDLTGNETYARLAQAGEAHLLEPVGGPETFPGLVGYQVTIDDGHFQDANGGWGGGVDSFYEYLIKMYVYDRTRFAQYRDRWVIAAESTMTHLASHPSTRRNLTFLSGHSGTSVSHSSGHLASFAGGNFILAGIALDETRYIDFGLALAESYFETYRQTESGIGPEGFQWTDGSDGSAVPSSQAGFYSRAGFWTSGASYYILRPETMESLYYAYRVTGDSKYQDMAWDAFSAIRRLCQTAYGFSGISNVRRRDGGSWDNFQQSFWLAETLKYAYLIFAPESEVQLHDEGGIDFVFNTEAHPMRVARR